MTVVPHTLQIIYGAVLLGLLAVGCWFELRGCTCKDKPEVLRLKFKKYNRKGGD
jgi:hypothetical protein